MSALTLSSCQFSGEQIRLSDSAIGYGSWRDILGEIMGITWGIYGILSDARQYAAVLSDARQYAAALSDARQYAAVPTINCTGIVDQVSILSLKWLKCWLRCR